MRAAALAIIAIAGMAAVAKADAEADADQAFRAAEQRAAANDPRAIDLFEALARAQPVTRWTDDAWAEAARLAERARDFDRARRNWSEALRTATDDQLRRRARAALDRLAATTGATGQWTAVAREHEQLLARLAAADDPKPALADLEAFARAHPEYPRAVDVRVALARAWERDGDSSREVAWLRDAVAVARAPADVRNARVALARALVRAGELDDAEAERDALGDATPARIIDADLDAARQRAWIHRALWLVLAAIAAAAAVALYRDAGGARAALRRLARPPVEVWFLAPVAIVLVAVAQTGNPMVARAVRAIALVGVAIAWLSGVVLDGARRRGRVSLARALGHAALAAVAVVAAAYLAIDRGHMIQLIAETIHEGPEMR